MRMYNATIEVDKKTTSRQETTAFVDRAMDDLAPFHPALGTSPRGWLTATITLPGENLTQATAAAISVVTTALSGNAILAEVMTEAEFDARQGWNRDHSTETVTVPQAAELLNVTTQAILDRIRRHTLPAEKVGRDYQIPRTALQLKTGN